MLLPIGDTPNPRNYTPWVNYGLIAANVLVYLLISLPLSLQQVDPADPALLEYLRVVAPSLPRGVVPLSLLQQITPYDLFVFQWGYKPGVPQVADLFASMFLHGGFLHLAGNMLFLWIFGDNVEHRLGRAMYLVVYLATGAVATLTFAVFAGDSMIPLVGASGAISGVLGLYFVMFRRNRVKTFVFLFPFLFDVFLIPARWVLGFYVLVDNLLPFLIGAASGVAYGAHLGGFVAGLGAAWAGERTGWRWPWGNRQWRAGRREARTGPRAVRSDAGEASGLEALQAAIERGDAAEAVAAVSGLSRAEMARLGPDACVQLSDWLDQAGHPAAATSMLRRCLSSHRGSDDLARVYLALGLNRLRQGQPTAAYQHLLSVFDYDPSPQVAAQARAALEQIEVYRRGRRH